MKELKKEVWELKTSCQGGVSLNSSGMTILTYNRENISVGYSQRQRLQHARLMSASPEMARLLEEASVLINLSKIPESEKNNFNKKYELINNKLIGEGEINKPKYCRASYEWTEDHIEKYHVRVNREIRSEL